ncbi:hypothetical protein C7271_01965 [filamentous cyanobacterium CCP5]|nr:hypothetical protein C7271_01965 [filamentous cyanobacterium CCP5]
MIICSSCNFENPGNHRFCQECGHPLQVWRAFLIPENSGSGESATPTSHGPSATSKSSSGSASDFFSPDPSNSVTYLDLDQRYQLQEPIPPLPDDQIIEIRVIDAHPAAESPIADIQTSWLQDPDLNAHQSMVESGIPPEAVPYLALQADFFPIVPELHDAWLTPHHTVLLIEDRSPWPLLQDCWQRETNLLQRISWLYEITLLWEALAPWGTQSTLLSLGRLRVDQDQILCLEYLSGSPTPIQPTLSELGLAWRPFSLIGSPSEPLKGLIEDLANGAIVDTETLKQRLAQIAEQSEALADDKPALNLPMTAPPPEFEDEGNFLSSSSHGQIQTTPEVEAFSLPLEAPDSEILLTSETNRDMETTDPFSLEDWQATEEDADTIDSPTMVLPMKLVQLNEIGRTYVGRQREHNEDCYCAQTHLQKRDSPEGDVLQAKGIYILCDGMGGHASGEVASELAVKTLMEFFDRHWHSSLPSKETLLQGVIAANQAIYQINQANASSGSGRMGTTLVMVLIQDTRAVVVHVGDSRLYTYTRRLGLSQVTTDHEVGQREIQRGVEPAIAYARPDAYQLTQALGPRSQKDLKPEISYIDIFEDTLFLLCSDGLSDNEVIERHCDTHIEPLLRSQADLEQGVTKLISLANEQNGHDNITAILVQVKLKPDMGKLPE